MPPPVEREAKNTSNFKEGDVPPPVEREAKNTSNFKNFYNTIRACQLMCPCLTSCGHQATSCEDSWRMKGHYALCAVCTK